MFSAELSPTLRRLLFRSHALSKSLSANEAFVWSKNEIANMDKFISAAARNCMRGKAVEYIKFVDNEGVEVINETRSKSSKEVFEVFKFAGVVLEMITRRCKMYQRWARHRNSHRQVLAHCLGVLFWRVQTLAETALCCHTQMCMPADFKKT